jgi:chitodextrinase
MKTRILPAAVIGLFAVLALALASASPAAAAIRDRTPPTAPTNLRATAVGQTSVALAWNPSTDDVGVVKYIAGALDLPLQVLPSSRTSTTFTGLRPNTTYVFRVQAYDGINVSPTSNPLTITTARETTAPSVPSGLALSNNRLGVPVDGVTASKVLLSWNSSTDAFGPISYEVLANGVPTPNAWSSRLIGAPTAPSTGAWVRQLEPATTYQFSVRARDGSGNVSALSNTVTITTDPVSTPDTTPPTSPTLISAGSAGTSYCPEELWVSWNGSTDNATAATAIEYEIRINGTIVDVETGVSRSITYTDVGGANAVTIVAVDAAGNGSAPSNTIAENIQFGIDCPA